MAGPVMSHTFDPYRVWLGIPAESRPPTHYELLGISPKEQERAVIEAAVLRQSGYVRNFQLGKYAKDAAKVLNEIAAAKACLLDPVKRAKYDAELKVRQARNGNPQYPVTAPALVRQAPLTPAIDLDFLTAVAAPLPASPAKGRQSTALRLKPRKRKRSRIGWRLPAGLAVAIAVMLAALALWPRHADDPRPTAADPPPVLSGTVQTDAAAGNPGVPSTSEEPPVEPPAPPPLAIAPFSAQEARQHQERWAKYLGREIA